jgi:hypothetical protein
MVPESPIRERSQNNPQLKGQLRLGERVRLDITFSLVVSLNRPLPRRILFNNGSWYVDINYLVSRHLE